MTNTAQPEVDTELAQLYSDAEALDTGHAVPLAVDPTLLGGEGTTDVAGDEPKAEDVGPSSVPEADAPKTDTEPEDTLGTDPEPTADKPLAEAEAATHETTKPTRADKKREALDRTWDNAERRHREAETREISIATRERQMVEREQQLVQKARQVETPDDPLPKHSLDDLAASLAEFVDEGDAKMAKQLARSIADKAKAQIAAQGTQGPQFTAAWDATRQFVLKSNPELADSKSPLYITASKLLTGEWGPFFQAHTSGAAAAVEVAKLQLQLGRETGMADKVKKLETENQTLRKKLQLDGSTPTSRDVKSDDFSSLSADKQLAQLRREAEALTR